MRKTLFGIAVAVAAVAVDAGAQESEESKREPVAASPTVESSAQASNPLYADPLYKALLEKAALLSRQSPAGVKTCPMPVQRPDTSRLERPPVARAPFNVSFPMQRIELTCPNPLDTPR
jgi:hypothetical protein